MSNVRCLAQIASSLRPDGSQKRSGTISLVLWIRDLLEDGYKVHQISTQRDAHQTATLVRHVLLHFFVLHLFGWSIWIGCGQQVVFGVDEDLLQPQCHVIHLPLWSVWERRHWHTSEPFIECWFRFIVHISQLIWID